MKASADSIAIGLSDFRTLRRENYLYVDKSSFIVDILENKSVALLFPRPRRFGKTLNLSMLRYFFEKSTEDRTALFQGLAVEQSALAKAHFQRYPVMFITLKDIKASTWTNAFDAIKGVIAQLYSEHRYLLEGALLTSNESKTFQAILSKQATDTEYWQSLADLSRYLHQYHNERVVLLIDEYDTGLHAAYTNGYYSQAIEFFRNFLSGALKDNPHLFKGVVTGILRIAKESIFSGLNNLAVYSILDKDFSDSFGFTEAEVEQMVTTMAESEQLPELKAWYNGYHFGNQTIYNPWSVLNFLKRPDHGMKAYWVQTSSNELIRHLLFPKKGPLKSEIEILLQGGMIEKPIEETVSLRDLEDHPQALWSFLLFCGYLTTESVFQLDYRTHAQLRLVNREVLGEFYAMTQMWFEQELGPSLPVDRLLKGLLQGHAELVEEALSHLLAVNLSYHDFTTQIPERVYHAFVLGLLVYLGSRYEVKSNRESGSDFLRETASVGETRSGVGGTGAYVWVREDSDGAPRHSCSPRAAFHTRSLFGRYDLMLIPKQKKRPGIILEFKVVNTKKGETLEAALESAFLQIEKQKYSLELQERGASPIYQYAVAFLGKQAQVEVKTEQ